MVGGRGWGSFFSIWISSVFQHHLLQRPSYPCWIVVVALSEIKWSCKWGSISGLFIPFRWSICLSLCWYRTALVTAPLWWHPSSCPSPYPGSAPGWYSRWYLHCLLTLILLTRETVMLPLSDGDDCVNYLWWHLMQCHTQDMFSKCLSSSLIL